MAIAAALLAVLCLIYSLDRTNPSGLDVHPDERLHLSCYDWFLHHALPGAVDDPDMQASLTASPFGYSYLDEYDIVYFVTARATGWAAAWFDSPLGAPRLFQHLLWALLIVAALRRHAWSLGASVLLVSPQVWYVYTYFNGDAFPLFLGVLAALLVGDRDSGVHRWLAGGGRPTGAAIALAACLGFLVVSKSNYLPLVPGFLLLLGVRHLDLRGRELAGVLAALAAAGAAAMLAKVATAREAHWPLVYAVVGGVALAVAGASLLRRLRADAALRPRLLRMLALVALLAAFAAPRVVDDWLLNGGPAAKQAALRAAAERYAQPDFRPSVLERGGGWPTTALAAKGVHLGALFRAPYSWATISLASSFGVYGYMTVWAPAAYYVAIGLCAALLLVLVALALRRALPDEAGRWGLVAGGTAALVALSSLLYSWVVGLQPQGRYLLPAAALLAALTAAAAPQLRRGYALALAGAFALGIGSWLGVALPAFAS